MDKKTKLDSWDLEDIQIAELLPRIGILADLHADVYHSCEDMEETVQEIQNWVKENIGNKLDHVALNAIISQVDSGADVLCMFLEKLDACCGFGHYHWQGMLSMLYCAVPQYKYRQALNQ